MLSLLILCLIYLYRTKYALKLHIFVSQLEAPSQLERMKYQQDSLELLHSLETNLSRLLRQKSEDSLDKFEEYQDRIKAYQTIPEEIQWEMLSASAFVTGVSTTTGDLIVVQLNEYETAPYLIQFSQNLTCVCLLISVFSPKFT